MYLHRSLPNLFVTRLPVSTLYLFVSLVVLSKVYYAMGRAAVLMHDPIARREGAHGGVRLAWSGI
jgi:hypothetical protein